MITSKPNFSDIIRLDCARTAVVCPNMQQSTLTTMQNAGPIMQYSISNPAAILSFLLELNSQNSISCGGHIVVIDKANWSQGCAVESARKILQTLLFLLYFLNQRPLSMKKS